MKLVLSDSYTFPGLLPLTSKVRTAAPRAGGLTEPPALLGVPGPHPRVWFQWTLLPEDPKAGSAQLHTDGRLLQGAFDLSPGQVILSVGQWRGGGKVGSLYRRDSTQLLCL